jgi:hypothetical protein
MILCTSVIQLTIVTILGRNIANRAGSAVPDSMMSLSALRDIVDAPFSLSDAH